MEISYDYNELNNQGIELLEAGIKNQDEFSIESSIQYFKKAIASAELIGISNFEIANNNLDRAKNELNKLKQV